MNFRQQLKEMTNERTDDTIKDNYKPETQEIDIETVFTSLPSDDEEIRRGNKLRKLRKRYQEWRQRNTTK